MRKRIKIYDCFFYHDEIEMLNFRLNTLKQYVDYFVIIEFAQNFMFESKDGYLDFEKISEEIPKEKIIHLKIPSLTLESVNAIYLKTKIKRFLIDLEKDGLNKTDFIKVATIRLKEFLTSIDFIIDDLIMLSDVDEIPDFRMIDEIKKRLIYGPVFLKNKNFIWSDSFSFQTLHEGNVILNFSHLVINDKVFIESINSRNVFRGRKNTIKCGWHFSHFYDINRTLKKLRVLHPEKFITQELLIESLKNLEYPLLNDFGVKEKLIENEEIFPFPTKGLPKTFLGRKKSKKNLILFDENTSIDRNIFDCVFEIKMENKFLPKKVLYGNYSEKEFEKVFVLNDVPKILKKSFPLNQDIFYFIFDSEISQAEIDKEVGFIDSEKRFAIFDWETMKKNILSDLVFGSVS